MGDRRSRLRASKSMEAQGRHLVCLSPARSSRLIVGWFTSKNSRFLLNSRTQERGKMSVLFQRCVFVLGLLAFRCALGEVATLNTPRQFPAISSASEWKARALDI